MKLSDVKSEIFSLGFEAISSYKENPNIILQAINRAMSTITTEVRPIIDKVQISQHCFENVASNSGYQHYSKAPIIITAEKAKSYCFECDGVGIATIKDNDSEKTIQLDSNKKYKEYKGFCNGNTTITFGGDFSYNIKNVAIYNEKVSDNVDDIQPYRNHIRYDFSKLTNGKFIGFMDKVAEGAEENGTYISLTNFEIEQRKILVLNGFEKCEYTVFYKKAFTPVTNETDESFEIELDSDVCVLLPLLASYYVWLDDDERKATMYYNNYESLRNAVIGTNTGTIAKVKCKGWL